MATRRYSTQELDNVRRWLEANQDSASEKMISELTEMIEQDYLAKRVIATNSCMAALHIALQTIGVGPGDEVIVDPIVVFAGMATMYHNAVPIFADIDLHTFNIDPASIVKQITPRTKAIICTHHFGNICSPCTGVWLRAELHDAQRAPDRIRPRALALSLLGSRPSRRATSDGPG